MTGNYAKPKICILKLLLRPWDLSHRVERQKLTVTSREEMYVRVCKGGFCGWGVCYLSAIYKNRQIIGACVQRANNKKQVATQHQANNNIEHGPKL